MKRSDRFLDYVEENDIENAEVALVREIKGLEGRTLNSYIEELLNGQPAEALLTAGADYYYAKYTDGDLPEMDLPEEDGYELTHAILYATDFGRQPITDAGAVTRVITAIADDPPLDLLGEYLLCLFALNETLPSLALTAFTDVFDDEWTEYNHTYAVGAVLFALMDD